MSLFSLCLTMSAQDGGGNDKNFRFGLMVEPSFNWVQPDNAKDFANGGVKMGFGIGAITDFKLGGNVWLSTGINMDFSGAKLKYLDNNNSADTTGYFYYDDAIVEIKNISDDSAILSKYSMIQLESRNYSVNYVNIPIYIKMKTNEIGYMTYYGQFGLHTSVKTKARAKDEGKILVGSDLGLADLADMNIDSEVSPIKMAASIGGGFEYNISGSTSLFVSLNYNYGFTSVTKKNSKHVIDFDKSDLLNATPSYVAYSPQKNIVHGIRLSVGMLF